LRLFDIDLIPVLRSKRLTLREMKPGDSYDMYEYSREPSVTKYLLWSEHPDEAFTRRHLKCVHKRYRTCLYYDWAIIYCGGSGDAGLKSYEGRMIGTCGFASLDLENKCGEIGYVLNPHVWGHGIAKEAAQEVIRFGFEALGLERIEARYMIGNDASKRVMEKLGMKYEGTHRSLMYVKGIYRDIGVCSILRGEYFQKKYSRI